MTYYDISMEIWPGMPVYKNDEAKRPRHTVEKQLPRDSVTESSLWLNLHTGTHMDAPRHMRQDGAPTASIPLPQLLGACQVYDLTPVDGGIGRAHLQPLDIPPGEFILLKTKNSAAAQFEAEFVYLAQDGAQYLAQRQVRGVGIDSLGIERAQPDHATHLTLMNAGIVILEGLALAQVPPGPYCLIALPLKIRQAEGAPARAILIAEDEGRPLARALGRLSPGQQ